MSELEQTVGFDVPPVVSRRLVMSGVVQGVGFRFFLAQEARKAGLVGYVRNLDDGRVEAVLQGPRPAVAKIEAWCHHGPELARVQSVETTDVATTNEGMFVIAE
jgi:acylphosphatase